MSEAIQVNQWVAVKLEDSGKYGYALQEGYINKAGEFKVSFCKREFAKQGEKTEKNVPMSIKLGDKDKAIAVLQELLDNLAAPF
jgi:hypothetical protein